MYTYRLPTPYGRFWLHAILTRQKSTKPYSFLMLVCVCSELWLYVGLIGIWWRWWWWQECVIVLMVFFYAGFTLVTLILFTLEIWPRWPQLFTNCTIRNLSEPCAWLIKPLFSFFKVYPYQMKGNRWIFLYTLLQNILRSETDVSVPYVKWNKSSITHFCKLLWKVEVKLALVFSFSFYAIFLWQTSFIEQHVGTVGLHREVDDG